MEHVEGIAIVGMAGRFPGANSTSQLWDNLVLGKESITFFTDEQLAAVEHDYEAVRANSQYVRARGVIDGIEEFDAKFFGFSPKEARLLDPQQRVWFECAWEALEDAGCDPHRFEGPIGVFAGSGYLTSYLLHNLCADRAALEDLVRLRDPDAFHAIICNDKDFLPTRTSHLFDLHGPSINVQTACSTSLVAVAQACQSLAMFESDVCLAGGISIQLPQDRGYLVQHGGMDSPDGHVRAFDARAGGTVFSNGSGVVVLRRLKDAIADNNHIYAVIKGWAVNNDGAQKQSYVGPNPQSQAEVVAAAQSVAGFDAETITYVEAHGTATQVGDPIEIAALTQAFRRHTDRREFCGIGSLKSNLGHLDAAAGVAGLIKTSLSLQHKQLPPSLHFEQPNPQINFADSPFYVVDRLTEWESRDGTPRRAGVSSFGVGGTNVHVVLEEAPVVEPQPVSSRDWQLVVYSAKTAAALGMQAEQLSAHLSDQPQQALADVAYTLQQGRTAMRARQFAVCRDLEDASARLNESASRQQSLPAIDSPSIVFMFPGQGSQFVNMALELYRGEQAFRTALDECLRILSESVGLELREVLFPASDACADAGDRLRQTRYAQPALFSIEYAYAALLAEWGVTPAAMIGHSVGEFTAAHLAGVFTLEDALRLLVARGALMQQQPAGKMLAVPLSESEVQPYLKGDVVVAACNAPDMTVLSGTSAAVSQLVRTLQDRDVSTIPLQTSHAFHSPMMDAVLPQFAEVLSRTALSAPTLPFISSLTGQWITAEQACSAEYWTRQLRQAVRFREGIEHLVQEPGRLLLEVGPGTALTSLARRQKKRSNWLAIPCSRRPSDSKSEMAALLEAVGELWRHGAPIDWEGLHGQRNHRKVPLPTYPFERKRFWVDPPRTSAMRTEQAPFDQTPPDGESNMIRASTSNSEDSTQQVQPAEARRDYLEKQLIEMITDLSGIELEPSESGVPFVELGMDSLFLTQLSTALQGKFGTGIKFRRLMEDVDTVAALSDYYDQQLPADAFQPPAPEATEPAAPAAEVVPEGQQLTPPAQPPVAPTVTLGPAAQIAPTNSVAESIIQQQLALMAKQIDLLGGSGGQASQDALRMVSEGSIAPSAATPSPAQRTGPSTAPPDSSKPAQEEAPSLAKKPFGASARISTTGSDDLTGDQRRFLEEFISRYAARTRESKRFTQRHRRHMSDPRAVSGFTPLWKEIVYPIVVNKSQGAKLWDLDGNEYVDLTCGFGSNFLGNSPPFIVSALSEQLDTGYEVGPQHPLAGEVAELMERMTGMERFAFCNTGSEAVMGAVRQARTVTGRQTVVIFANSYHGICDEVIVRGARNCLSVPAAPGIPRSKVENVLVLDYGADESLEIIRERAGELAAVLVEPVQSRRPDLQPAEFLHKLRALTAERDIALIFDEVITGFRISPGGAQEYFGIRADLATYGKIIGGGLPFAAIAGNARYMDALDGGYWDFGDESFPEAGVTYFAGTFVRHPLALAAAKASLEHLLEEGPALQQRLNAKTESLVAHLNGYFESVAAPLRLTNFGSLCRVAVSEDVPHGSLLYYLLRDKGIHIWEGFGCFLTTAHQDEDIAHVIAGFEQSVAEMQASGFLPGLAASGAGPERNGAHRVPHDTSQTRAPLTDPQREVWFASQISDTASSSYNESFALRLQGSLNFEVLRQAIDAVIRRHDALSVRFDAEGSEQIRTADALPDFQLIDLADVAQAEQDQRIREVYASEACDDFDLARGSLVRFRLIKFAADDHTLVTTAHHIVFDGWSGGVFVEELGAVYNALLRGDAIGLDEAPSFLAYAQDEAERYKTAEYRKSLDFWKSTFPDGGPLLELPCDHARPSTRTYRGDTVRWESDPALFRALKGLAARQGTTVFTLMLAAFKVLLHRLSGQGDLVVGVPTAGQALYDQEWLVGHCANIIPLRTQADSGTSFVDHLQAVKSGLLDAQEHQQCTLGAILREVPLDRVPGRAPLVEVLFNLNRELPQCSMTGLDVRLEELPKAATHWDLFLDFDATDDGFSADCDFNTDLYDAATIQRWMGYFEVLLNEITRDADRAIGELPILPASESQQLLETWNATRTDYPSDVCVHELIDRQAQHAPHQLAVSDAQVSLNYGELRSRSSRIANYLVSRGIRPADRVGVFMDRSAETVCVLLGVLRCGAAYVPLDPTYPQHRNEQRCRDAGLAAVITVSAQAARAPECSTLIVVDECGSDLERQRETHRTEISTSELAYILYTSGSAGQPKGVGVSHRALTNFLCSMKTEPGFTQDDTMLSVTTLSFDIAALEIYLPLVCGGRVVIADRPTATDGQLMAQAMDRHGVTVMQATPSMWQVLLRSGWRGHRGLKMLCGGEALPLTLAQELVEKGESLWNMYGPTETTIWSSVQRVLPGDSLVSIGRPIANTQFYILNDRMQPQPTGVPGVLYIAGDGLAEGYIGRSELTAERFVRCPFEPNVRMYNTGDSARYLADGRVECLGRVDSQVKLRGFRIELGEIEEFVNQHPDVQQCVVALREHAGQPTLVAYLTLSGSSQPSTSDLHAFSQQFLPDYMIPAHFVVLDQLPLLPSGKVDRQALPEPDLLRPDLVATYQPPRTAAERLVGDVWRSVLGVEKIGIDDSFFELGGHSILVVQSVVKLRDQLGTDIPLGIHFEFPTIRRLCERLHEAGCLPDTVESPKSSSNGSRERFVI